MTGGLGQIGHSPGRRAFTSVAVLAAGSLLAAVGLSACGVDAAKASTVVRDARAATLQLADGTTKAASDGATVPRGAVVTTAPGGSVSLVTSGRVVLLGSDTSVAVLDGRREQLRKGLVMVDGRKAGELELDAGAATVTTTRGSVTRVERDALLRVASFRRDASVRAAGRRATVKVDALHQVQVPYGGLPGRVTALGLTRDTWERRYALDLVTRDVDLNNLAAGLDANPSSTAAIGAVLPATYRNAVPLAAGEKASEQTLGFLIARAGHDDAKTYENVRGWRAEGGSWGVVAALADADVAEVSSALDAILEPNEPVLAAEPGGGSIDVGGLFGGSGPTGSGGGLGPGQTGASPRPVSGPAPSRTPSPRPSSSPDPVQQVVTTVQSLLPSPPPVVPPPPAETKPSASPSPLLQVDIGGIKVGLG
jgi:hypothetical protein